jgi:hypothetical protein
MYDYRVREMDKKKDKCMKKYVVDKVFAFDNYKSCFYDQREKYKKVNLTRNYTQGLYSIEVNKLA